MSCIICDNKTKSFTQVNQTSDFSGIEISIDGEGLLRVRTYNNVKQMIFENQDFIKLTYCPFCGEKFKEV